MSRRSSLDSVRSANIGWRATSEADRFRRHANVFARDRTARGELRCGEAERVSLSLDPGVGSTRRQGPDGNSIILDAPDGLIVFDTGRHPEHRTSNPRLRQERGRPVAAIVNSHWHLDHTTGNLGYSPGLSASPGLRDHRDRRCARDLSPAGTRRRLTRRLPIPKLRQMERAQILRGRYRHRSSGHAASDPSRDRSRAE